MFNLKVGCMRSLLGSRLLFVVVEVVVDVNQPLDYVGLARRLYQSGNGKMDELEQLWEPDRRE